MAIVPKRNRVEENQRKKVFDILIIIGKTASGKDTILNILTAKHGYKKLTTYTTRPIRPNEKQDTTYHFVSEDDFQNKVENKFFAEWKSYDTEFGLCYYGTALEDLKNADDKTVIILAPDGYRDIVNRLPNKPKAIYVYANNSTIKERLLKRGDNKDEAQRRLEHDNTDFKGIENEVDKIFYNNNNTNIDDVVDKILDWLQKG